MSQKVSPIVFNNYVYNTSKWFNKRNNKFLLNEETYCEYDSVLRNIQTKQILKDIDLIREEIKKQNVYININLSVDALMLQLKSWVK